MERYKEQWMTIKMFSLISGQKLEYDTTHSHATLSIYTYFRLNIQKRQTIHISHFLSN